MTTQLQETWQSAPSFRQAVISLTNLPQDSLTELSPSVLYDQGLWASFSSTPTFRSSAEAFTALRFLSRSVEDYSDVEALLDDLQSLLQTQDDDAAQRFVGLRDGLHRVLYRDPEDLRRRRIANVQHASLPVLEDVDFEIDFRVVKGSPDSDATKFVPVLLLRLTFDEPVINGHESFAFQAHPDLLDSLSDLVSKSSELLRRAEDAVRDRLL